MPDSYVSSPADEVEERRATLTELEEWLRIPMLVLSAIWAVLVGIELTMGENELLSMLSTAIWIIFGIEFAVRLWLAPKKFDFIKHNWLTALALLLPALRLLRAFAIFRLARSFQALRAFRLVRLVGAANRSMNAFRTTMQRRKVGYVTAVTLTVTFLGAAGMYNLEPASEMQEGGFTSYWDALWWTAMLLTTIGSQYWPVSVEARILAVLLSIYGLGVLGYITATLASFFVGRDRDMDVVISDRLDAIDRKLDQLAARQ